MGQIHFEITGAESPEKLSMENPLIFRAARKFPTLKGQAGESLKPTNSKTIPKAFTEKLEGIQGRFLLRQYKKSWRDMHLYSDDAIYIDGVCRICYLQYSEERDALKVTENGTIRNSGYSGLYRELIKRMREGSYDEENGIYYVAQKQIDDFVKIVNAIIADKKKGVLELYPVDEIDTMTLLNSKNEAKKYYYYKAYWGPKDLGRESEMMLYKTQRSDGVQAVVLPAYDAVRKLGELSVNGTLDEVRVIRKSISELKQKLDKVEKWTLARLAMIEGLKGL